MSTEVLIRDAVPMFDLPGEIATARAEIAHLITVRDERVEKEQEAPEKQPAQSPSLPGPTYENPNEDETYEPPAEDDGDDEHRR